MKDQILYYSILRYDFDEDYEPDQGYRFVDKLMANNLGWDQVLAETAIIEYKRFIYLVTVYGHLAPSDVVDQVWHQHILYTADYTKFCKEVLGRFIHHRPDRNAGASSEGYDRLVHAYKQEFGEEPPAEIWKLGGDYKRVNLEWNYVIPIDNAGAILQALIDEVKYKLMNKLNQINK